MSNIRSVTRTSFLLFFIFLSAGASAQSTVFVNISTDPNPDIFEPPTYPIGMKNKVVYAKTQENFTVYVRNNGPSPVWRIEIRVPKLYTDEHKYFGISDPQLMYEIPYEDIVTMTAKIDCPDPNGLGEWSLSRTLYTSANGSQLVDVFVCTHSGVTNRLDTSKSTEVNFTGYAVQPYWRDETLQWNVTAYFGTFGGSEQDSKEEETITALPMHLNVDPLFDDTIKNKGQIFRTNITLNVSDYAKSSQKTMNEVNLSFGVNGSWEYTPPERHSDLVHNSSTNYSVFFWREYLYKADNIVRGAVHMAADTNVTPGVPYLLNGTLNISCSSCTEYENLFVRFSYCNTSGFDYVPISDKEVYFNTSVGISPSAITCYFEGYDTMGINYTLEQGENLSFTVFEGTTQLGSPVTGQNFSRILVSDYVTYDQSISNQNIGTISSSVSWSNVTHVSSQSLGSASLIANATFYEYNTSRIYNLTKVIDVSIVNTTRAFASAVPQVQERGRVSLLKINLTFADGSPLWGMNLDLHPNTSFSRRARIEVDRSYFDPDTNDTVYIVGSYINFTENSSGRGTYLNPFKVPMNFVEDAYGLLISVAFYDNNLNYSFDLEPTFVGNVFNVTPTDELQVQTGILMPWPDVLGQLVGVEINVTDSYGEEINYSLMGFPYFNVTVVAPDGASRVVEAHADYNGTYRAWYTLPLSMPNMDYNVSFAVISMLNDTSFNPNVGMARTSSYAEIYGDSLTQSLNADYFRQWTNLSEFDYNESGYLTAISFIVNNLSSSGTLWVSVFSSNGTLLYLGNETVSEIGTVTLDVPNLYFDDDSGHEFSVAVNSTVRLNITMSEADTTLAQNHTLNRVRRWGIGYTEAAPYELYINYTFGNLTRISFSTQLDSRTLNVFVNESIFGTVLSDARVMLSWVDSVGEDYTLTKFTDGLGFAQFILPVNLTGYFTYDFIVGHFGYGNRNLTGIVFNASGEVDYREIGSENISKTFVGDFSYFSSAVSNTDWAESTKVLFSQNFTVSASTQRVLLEAFNLTVNYTEYDLTQNSLNCHVTAVVRNQTGSAIGSDDVYVSQAGLQNITFSFNNISLTNGSTYKIDLELEPQNYQYDYAMCAVLLDSTNDTDDVYQYHGVYGNDTGDLSLYYYVYLTSSYFDSPASWSFVNATANLSANFSQYVNVSDFGPVSGFLALNAVEVDYNYSKVVNRVNGTFAYEGGPMYQLNTTHNISLRQYVDLYDFGFGSENVYLDSVEFPVETTGTCDINLTLFSVDDNLPVSEISNASASFSSSGVFRLNLTELNLTNTNVVAPYDRFELMAMLNVTPVSGTCTVNLSNSMNDTINTYFNISDSRTYLLSRDIVLFYVGNITYRSSLPCLSQVMLYNASSNAPVSAQSSQYTFENAGSHVFQTGVQLSDWNASHDYYLQVSLTGTNISPNRTASNLFNSFSGEYAYSNCGVLLDGVNNTTNYINLSGPGIPNDIAVFYYFTNNTSNFTYVTGSPDRQTDMINSMAIVKQYFDLSDPELGLTSLRFSTVVLGVNYTGSDAGAPNCSGSVEIWSVYGSGSQQATSPVSVSMGSAGNYTFDTPSYSRSNLSGYDFFVLVKLFGNGQAGNYSLCSLELDGVNNTTDIYDTKAGQARDSRDAVVTVRSDAVGTPSNTSQNVSFGSLELGFGTLIQGDNFYNLEIVYSGNASVLVNISGSLWPSGMSPPYPLPHHDNFESDDFGDHIFSINGNSSISLVINEGDITIQRVRLKPAFVFVLDQYLSNVKYRIGDSDSYPVNGASVTMTDYHSKPYHVLEGGITSGIGEVVLYPEPGFYEVLIEKDGFIPQYMSLEITDDNSVSDQIVTLYQENQSNIEVEVENNTGSLVNITSNALSLNLTPGRPTLMKVRVRADNGSLLDGVGITVEESRGASIFSPESRNYVTKSSGTNGTGQAVFFVIPTSPYQHIDVTLNTTGVGASITETKKSLFVGKMLVAGGVSPQAFYSPLQFTVYDVSTIIDETVYWLVSWNV